jgi:ABC-type nitrate/sulfonate/bicarbonate transport system substrate-binding protein
MANLELTFVSQDYEHTRALFDGRVQVDGIDLKHMELFPSITFHRMVGGREFEFTEMAMTLYVSTLDLDDRPFIALPIFPVRVFRHSAIYVSAQSGIREPKDLIGRKMGEFFFYGHDAGIWAKGALSTEYGVAYDSYSQYYFGGIGHATPPLSWLPSRPPSHIRSEHIGTSRTLDAMLDAGEIDAVIGPVTPPSILKGAKTARRLFEDYETEERGYFRKTGIFPIMHTVVLRRDVYEKNPWIARALYKGFTAAKNIALARYRDNTFNNHTIFSLPWLTPQVASVQAEMGRDWWPYGLAANSKVLDAFLAFHHEQGLSKRRYTPEDMFVPETLAEDDEAQGGPTIPVPIWQER